MVLSSASDQSGIDSNFLYRAFNLPAMNSALSLIVGIHLLDSRPLHSEQAGTTSVESHVAHFREAYS